MINILPLRWRAATEDVVGGPADEPKLDSRSWPIPAAREETSPSRKGTATRAKRRAASIGIGVALAAGSIIAAGSPASAAAPCGLSYSGPVFGQYTYTIRNCHGYGVRRKLDLRKLIVGYPDGPCHYIPAHSSIRRTISLPDSVYIAGMKPC
jgi:hypothetical protein